MAIRQRATPAAWREPRPSPADEATAGGRRSFWEALAAWPVFRRLWLGALAASAAQWMQQIALGWLAVVMTNSPAFVGIVAFSSGVPFIVISPLGGILIDRFDRRKLMLICQGLACLLASLVAVDIMAGLVQPWHLPVAALLNGSLQALLSPTQQSLVPSLVPRGALTNAVGLMSAGQNMTRVVGPSIAGVVIGVAGVGQAFLLQAAALALSFAFVWGIALEPRAPLAIGSRGAFEGVRLVASRPDLRGLFLLVSIPMFFVFPYISFLNVFARDVLQIGAEGLGVLMAASGCGAVVGSLVVATMSRTEGTGRMLLWATILYGVPVLIAAMSRTVWITLIMVFLGSLLSAILMSANNAILQHRVTDDVRGRVTGAYMLTWGLMPLGSLPMGMAADRLGAPAAVAGGAIISTILAILLGLTLPAIREI
ncbi:MAG: MFS transporter [Thermomicrobiales bacterium]|nr:MFS transporter [Thermomicrobiales bacterium]